jgi:nitrogen fixation NifU-like protein
MNRDKKFDIVAEEIQRAILEEAKRIYSPRVFELFQHPKNLGVVKKANGFGIFKGICGDTMKVYLRIAGKRVREAKFETDGCAATIACGSAVTELARGKSVKQLLEISPAGLLEELGGLPPGHLHCAILAVDTLHCAVANYLFLEGSAS